MNIRFGSGTDTTSGSSGQDRAPLSRFVRLPGGETMIVDRLIEPGTARGQATDIDISKAGIARMRELLAELLAKQGLSGDEEGPTTVPPAIGNHEFDPVVPKRIQAFDA